MQRNEFTQGINMYERLYKETIGHEQKHYINTEVANEKRLLDFKNKKDFLSINEKTAPSKEKKTAMKKIVSI